LEESTYIAANDGKIELTVGTAILNKGALSSHHAYPVTGIDSLGSIECFRRYSHFEKFRSCLVSRYPGLYIPPIPSKVLSGKTENFVVQERQYFFDMFLKKCCELRYLAASQEMQIFCRPSGDIDK